LNTTDLCSLSISEASRLIGRKELAPTELLEAHLARIDKTNGKLNAFVTVMREEAVDTARLAEAEIQNGNHRGPLHGIPIALKDLFNTKGVRTAAGSLVMGDFVPDTDSTVAQRLSEAGAVITGKLQMDEFAMGATSVNPHDGPTRNPWDLERITGGSSGGSATAVAARLCMGAMGSDTGGSIRVPAMFCGIVGLKPTFGLVSRFGVLPVSWSLDTVGPMTRTVQDAALMLNAITGHDPRDLSTSRRPIEDFTATLDNGVKGIRVGVLEEAFSAVIEPEVGEILRTAVTVLEDLGAWVDDASISLIERTELSGVIMLAEYAAVHFETYRCHANEIGDQARGTIEDGLLVSGVDYVNAHRERARFNRQFAKVWDRFDVLVGPTERITAPTIEDASHREAYGSASRYPTLSSLVAPFNTTGSPSLTVPCGFTSAGMPVGMQVVAQAFEDATVLRIAQAYENATKWHTWRPPIEESADAHEAR
jgi:aspartyl-tRNA(Asn)/glutamyl-tRNA(Gln) amidotransferase subunit A